MGVNETIILMKLLEGNVGTIYIKRKTEKEAKKMFERATFLVKQIEQLMENVENV